MKLQTICLLKIFVIKKYNSIFDINVIIENDRNVNVKFLLYDKKEKHEVYKNFSYFHSNISVSQTIKNEEEPWYIVSNIEMFFI